MKCSPIIRGCSIAKVPAGIVFICVGIYLFANPLNYECGKMAQTCSGSLEDMMKALHVGDPGYNVATSEGEISSFCSCFQQCPNFFVVYEQAKSNPAATNCFHDMALLNISTPAFNTRRLGLRAGAVASPLRRLGDGGQALPGFAKDECQSCEDLEGVAKSMQAGFAITQIVLGIIILSTAGCEHLEMKWHSVVFSTCVILTDLAAASACCVSIMVSGLALLAVQSTCNSEAVTSSVTDGGSDSAFDPDVKAEFAKFFLGMLEPMLSDVCHGKVFFIIYHVSAYLGAITLFGTAISSLCVCMRCSDDGKTGVNTPDDMRALTLQSLHENGGPEDQW